MTAKHTPGPWTATISPGGIRILTNDGALPLMGSDAEGYPTRVALIDCKTEFKRGQGWNVDCAERDANARLIAAAPTMLDALERVEWWLTTVPQGAAMRDVCRAAIKEARGES